MSKRQGDHTVADIIRLKPEWFMKKQTDQAITQTHLAHIHTMLDHGFIKFADYCFIEVFGTYDISTLALPEINKALMEYAPRPPVDSAFVFAPRASKLLVPPEKLRDALRLDRRALKRNYEEALAREDSIKRNLLEYERKIKDYTDSMMNQLRDLAAMPEIIEDARKRAELKVGLDARKMAIIKAIPRQWMLVEAHTDYFTIVRREPLTMAYTNAASGMCQTLYMGFIGLNLYYHNLGCLGSFVVADGINNYPIHPHVSGNNICWGNTGHRAKRFVETGKYAEWFELLESLLTTYCPENPYVKFSDLERKKNDSYVALNYDGSDWFKENYWTLRRHFEQYGSDKYREKIAHVEPPPELRSSDRQNGLIKALFVMNERMEEKWDVLDSEVKEFYRGSGRGMLGQEVIDLFHRHGLRLPTPRMLANLSVLSLDGIHHLMKIVCIAYPEAPIKIATGHYIDLSGRNYGRYRLLGLCEMIRITVEQAAGGRDTIGSPSVGLHSSGNWMQGSADERTASGPRFPIGTEVTMSPDSQYWRARTPSNPQNMRGIVTHAPNPLSERYRVEWANGTTNSYTEEDLMLFLSVAPIAHTVPASGLQLGVRVIHVACYGESSSIPVGEIDEIDEESSESSERYHVRWNDGDDGWYRGDDLTRTNLPFDPPTEEDDLEPWEICDNEGHDWNPNTGVCRRCGADCEHEYDSAGSCEYCGYYDADYDESLEEEVAEDAVSF